MNNQSITTMRLYGVVTDSIVDGPGFRTAIFTQGCMHHCEGCHNPDSHDPSGGKEWTLDDIEAKLTIHCLTALRSQAVTPLCSPQAAQN